MPNALKKMYKKAKAEVIGSSDVEVMVKEATNSDPYGPAGIVLADLSDMVSRRPEVRQEALQTLLTRLEEFPDKHRKIYKALVVIEYLLKNATLRVIEDIKDPIMLEEIEKKKKFHYINEENGQDEGQQVRTKATAVLNLLKDRERLTAERESAKVARSRIYGKTNESQSAGRPTLDDELDRETLAPSAASRDASGGRAGSSVAARGLAGNTQTHTHAAAAAVSAASAAPTTLTAQALAAQEEEQLQRAITLSLMEQQKSSTPPKLPTKAAPATAPVPASPATNLVDLFGDSDPPRADLAAQAAEQRVQQQAARGIPAMQRGVSELFDGMAIASGPVTQPQSHPFGPQISTGPLIASAGTLGAAPDPFSTMATASAADFGPDPFGAMATAAPAAPSAAVATPVADDLAGLFAAAPSPAPAPPLAGAGWVGFDQPAAASGGVDGLFGLGGETARVQRDELIPAVEDRVGGGGGNVSKAAATAAVASLVNLDNIMVTTQQKKAAAQAAAEARAKDAVPRVPMKTMMAASPSAFGSPMGMGGAATMMGAGGTFYGGGTGMGQNAGGLAMGTMFSSPMAPAGGMGTQMYNNPMHGMAGNPFGGNMATMQPQQNQGMNGIGMGQGGVGNMGGLL